MQIPELRHNKNRPFTNPNLLPDPLNVFYPYSSSLVRYDLVTEIPTNSVNASLDTVNFIQSPSSVMLTNGYIPLGSLTLPNIWTFSVFFRPAQNFTTIFYIENSLYLNYNKLTNQLTIERVLFGTVRKEIFVINLNIPLNQWTHITVSREADELRVFSNLTLIYTKLNFFYPIKSGLAFLGNNQTVNFAFVSLVPEKLNTYLTIPTISQSLATIDTTSIQQNKILHVLHKDIVGNSFIFGNNNDTTKYEAIEKRWSIAPRAFSDRYASLSDSLIVKLAKPLNLVSNYTLEVNFRLENLDNNVIIFSNWFTEGNTYFYLRYLKLSNQLVFVYITKSNQTVTGFIDNFNSTVETNLVVQVSNKVEVFVNGTKQLDLVDSIRPIRSNKFQFNANVQGNINSSTNVLLYSFAVYTCLKYTDDFIPFTESDSSYTLPSDNQLTLRHIYRNNLPFKSSFLPAFALTGSTTLNVPSTNVLTLTQDRSHILTTYYLSILIEEFEDIALENITLSTTTITFLPGEVSKTFNLNILNYNPNPYKKRFTLAIDRADSRLLTPVTINDARPLAKSTLTTISGYLDAFFSTDSTISGVIPNLAGTTQANTTATLEADSIFGKSYLIDALSEHIVLPSTISNIQTIVFVYLELITTLNRSYVGSNTEYTFNGGGSGEIVGELILNGTANDYVVAIEKTTVRIAKTALSANNSTYVTYNDLSNTITAYRKTVAGIWDEVGFVLNIQLADITGLDMRVSDNGNYIILGFKNALLGEGAIQVWERQGNSWVRDLQLSSPVPAPYFGGFGHQVCISNSGTRIAVTELNSNIVYIFDKVTNWSNVPTETIVGSDRFGFSIDSNSDLTRLLISSLDTSNSFLYELDTTWGLSHTFSDNYLVKLHPTDNLAIISNPLAKTVKVYEKTTTWSLKTTITSTIENFGYEVDITSDKTLYILDVDSSVVNSYNYASNYALEQTFDGGLNSNESIYTFSANDSTLIFSNYSNLFRLITKEGSALPQRIVAVRKNTINIPMNTVLNVNELNILTFNSIVPLKVDTIGSSIINTGLNGIFLGCIFFNRILSETEVNTVQDFVLKYLQLEKYSLYEN